MAGELNNRGLINCEIFYDGKCTKCGCDWTKHMHMKYEIKKSIKTVVNRKVQGELAQCKDNKKHAEILLKDLQNQLENIENEYHLIKESSMEFSAYLKYNSVKQGADPYYDYMSHLVRIEEDKFVITGNGVLLMDLRNMFSDYKYGVQYILDEIKNKRRTPLSSNELNRKILNLGHMKLSGSLIADIARIATQGSMEEE